MFYNQKTIEQLKYLILKKFIMQNESLLPRPKSATIFYVIATIFLVITALIYFDSIIKPIVIALFIWFVISQLKISIRKIKIGGKSVSILGSNIIAFIIIVLCMYLGGELLIRNIEGLAKSMPEYVANLDRTYADVSLLINNPIYADYVKKGMNELNLIELAPDFINSFSGTLANLAVVIIYVIFFIMEDASNKVKLNLLFLVKGEKYERFNYQLNQISGSIRSYIWSKTVISLITAVISYVILVIMKVDYAFFWSFLVFILNFIPYLGPAISSTLPAVFAAIIFDDLIKFVYVFAALGSVQAILGNFVEPKIMGKGTNLSPVSVLVSIAFWGMIWGVVGMILAVPVMAVVVIVLSQIKASRFMAILLSEKAGIPDLVSKEALLE